MAAYVIECPDGFGHYDVPGAYQDEYDRWWIGCETEWVLSTGGGEEPEEPGAAFDPATAGLMFSKGFTVIFLFWALGKVPALLIKLLR